LHELGYHPKAVFLTLTYDDVHKPSDGGLRPRDLQLFIKRFRKEVSPRKISYYAVGEYGENTYRPHYHAIFYNVASGDEVMLSKCWGLGFVYVGTVTADSINYVCKYIQKKLYGDLAKERYGGLCAPFARMSKGLGLKWMEENEDRLISDMGIRRQGRMIRMPRYYANKLGDKLDLIKINDLFIERSEIRRDEMIRKGIGRLEEWKEDAAQRHQVELDQTARIALKNAKL
jgi:hypothetical protein